MARAAVVVSAAALRVAVVVAGLGLEVGQEGRGRVSPWRWTAAVRSRARTGAVGPGAAASVVSPWRP